MAARARELKRDAVALYFVIKHPQCPWKVKLLASAIVAYALSPLDLIPDFIPVLGLVDDLILLPLGVRLAVRLVPAPLMEEARLRAAECKKPVSVIGATAVVAIWVAMIIGAVIWIRSRWKDGSPF